MKIILYIPLIVGLLCFGLSCKKPDCPPVVDCNFIRNILDLDSLYHIPNQYIAHATKVVPCVGQMDWKANAYLRLKENTLFNITFVKFSDSIELETREKFVCYSVPLKLGRHFASKQRPTGDTTVFTLTSSRTIEDGDVYISVWFANPKEDSWVQINKIDLEKKEVEGTFELFFYGGNSSFSQDRSEYVNLRSGTFRAKF